MIPKKEFPYWIILKNKYVDKKLIGRIYNSIFIVLHMLRINIENKKY